MANIPSRLSQTYPALPSLGGLMEQNQNETLFVLVEAALKTDTASFLGIHIFYPLFTSLKAVN